MGFQPRPCPFCTSRHLMNNKAEEKFQVTCMFCNSVGPARDNSSDAWLSWNGQGTISPPMFGGALEIL